MPASSAPAAVLTDGRQLHELTMSKVFKDFVVDLLLTGAAALTTINIVSVDAAVAQPTVVVSALLGATIRVVYRFVLRWATTP